jgi:hypothetical protein
MKQHKISGWIVIGVMVAALAFGVIPAFAQTATPPATATAPQAHAAGFGGRGGMCGQAGLDAAAKALKLTTTELQAQLWGGQTLSGLADKAGVKLADVQSAVQAACQQAQIDAINQAVKDGTLTQANADWLIEGIQKGYIGGGKGGFGMGFEMGGKGGFEMGGRGGRGHGMGGFGAPQGTTPNGTTPNSGGSTSPSRYTF